MLEVFFYEFDEFFIGREGFVGEYKLFMVEICFFFRVWIELGLNSSYIKVNEFFLWYFIVDVVNSVFYVM